MSTYASRRGLRKEEDRRRIYGTALALIEAKGFEATTVRDITAGAGVALGTFFNHYPGKEYLLVDYYLRLQEEVAAELGRPRRNMKARPPRKGATRAWRLKRIRAWGLEKRP